MLFLFFFFFFNDTATTEIYTLSLHDALPIFGQVVAFGLGFLGLFGNPLLIFIAIFVYLAARSEEHTSELQSPCNLVCRLLLEKKKNYIMILHPNDHHTSCYAGCYCDRQLEQY